MVEFAPAAVAAVVLEPAAQASVDASSTHEQTVIGIAELVAGTGTCADPVGLTFDLLSRRHTTSTVAPATVLPIADARLVPVTSQKAPGAITMHQALSPDHWLRSPFEPAGATADDDRTPAIRGPSCVYRDATGRLVEAYIATDDGTPLPRELGLYVVNRWDTRSDQGPTIDLDAVTARLDAAEPGDSVVVVARGRVEVAKILARETDDVVIELSDGRRLDASDRELCAVLPSEDALRAICVENTAIIGATSSPSFETWFGGRSHFGLGPSPCDFSTLLRITRGLWDVRLDRPFESCRVVPKKNDPDVVHGSADRQTSVNAAWAQTHRAIRKAALARAQTATDVVVSRPRAMSWDGVEPSFPDALIPLRLRPPGPGPHVLATQCGAYVTLHAVRVVGKDIPAFVRDDSVIRSWAGSRGAVYDAVNRVVLARETAKIASANDVRPFVQRDPARPARTRVAAMRYGRAVDYSRWGGGDVDDAATAFEILGDVSIEDPGVAVAYVDEDPDSGEKPEARNAAPLVDAFAEILDVPISGAQRQWIVRAAQAAVAQAPPDTDARSLVVRMTCAACAAFVCVIESDPTLSYLMQRRGVRVPDDVVDAIDDVASSKHFFKYDVTIRNGLALRAVVARLRDQLVEQDAVLADRIRRGPEAVGTLRDAIEGGAGKNSRIGAVWPSFRPSRDSGIVAMVRDGVLDDRIERRAGFARFVARGISPLLPSTGPTPANRWGVDVDGSDARASAARGSSSTSQRPLVAPDYVALGADLVVRGPTTPVETTLVDDADDVPVSGEQEDAVQEDVSSLDGLVPARGRDAETWKWIAGRVEPCGAATGMSSAVARALRTRLSRLAHFDRRPALYSNDDAVRLRRARADLEEMLRAERTRRPASDCAAFARWAAYDVGVRTKEILVDGFATQHAQALDDLRTTVLFATSTPDDVRNSLEGLRERDKVAIMAALEAMAPDERAAYVQLRNRNYAWSDLLQLRRDAAPAGLEDDLLAPEPDPGYDVRGWRQLDSDDGSTV